MKKLLLIVMACYALNARSQVNESENFIRLYSDSTIYAQKIRLRPDFSGSWALRADSRKVPLERVKFFNNEDGFYANTRKLNLFGEVSFAERIIDGKINLYQQVVYEPIPFDMDYYRFRDRRRETVNSRMFFNKGMADLQKVNYDNLSKAMANNPESLDLLKSYRKSRQTSTIMYIAGGSALLAGMITLVTGTGFKDSGSSRFGMSELKDKSFAPSFILLGIGTGLSIGGFFVQNAGSRNIERAVDAYNR